MHKSEEAPYAILACAGTAVLLTIVWTLAGAAASPSGAFATTVRVSESVESPKRPELPALPASGPPARVEQGPQAPSVPRTPRVSSPEVLDRTAVLSGVISVAGVGAAASIEFLAGPERGRVLHADDQGAFRSGPLFPGFAVCAVRSGSRSCVREVVLRHRMPTLFSLDFSPRGVVAGTVVDAEGRPVSGARIQLDGVPTRSGPAGDFRIASFASGRPRLSVHAEGFVPYREILPERGLLPDESARPDGALRIEVRRGAHLSLTVGEAKGAVEVYLFPRGGERLAGMPPISAYPWHELSPLRVEPGTTVELSDLPSTGVEAVAFGGSSRSAPVRAWLAAGQAASIALELDPLPRCRGRVLSGGQPVPGARLELQVLEPFRATQIALGDLGRHSLSQPLELLPWSHQEVAADAQGGFDVACSGLDRERRVLTFVGNAGRAHFDFDELARNGLALEIQVP